MLERDDILQAVARVEGYVRNTPVLRVRAGALTSAECWLKLECLQHTGSFKPRGVFNLLLSRRPSGPVVTASGGNAGLAVAYACRELGLAAVVYAPTSAPVVKLRRIADFGAEVVLTGSSYAEAFLEASIRAQEDGELFVHAYDAPEVLAGQGTLAYELDEEVPGLNTILVAVGGGGLVGGVTSWYRHRAQVVAVEPSRAPSLHAALERGEPVDVEVGGIAADSLGARRIGEHGFAAVRSGAVRSLLVADEEISAARQLLWDEFRLAVEAGGATALAALTSGAYRPSNGEKIGVILCGGNTNPCDLVSTA